MGSLRGFKVIQMKGIGPGPYAGMLLADMGAEVVVVERESRTPATRLPSRRDALSRGKKSIALSMVRDTGGQRCLLCPGSGFERSANASPQPGAERLH